MRLFRTAALTAALMAAAVPLLTSQAQAWRWRGAGLGWRGAAIGAAVVGSAIAARSGYGYPAYGYGYPSYGYGYGTGYGYAANTYAPAYSYGYGTGYGYPAYGGSGYAYHPVLRHRIYARAYGVGRHWRY